MSRRRAEQLEPRQLQTAFAGTDSTSDTQSPGVMRSESWMTLHTRQAQRLVQGRRADKGQPGIVGVTLYAALLRAIWNGARADDPYADWWLVKIHDALELSWNELEEMHRSVLRIMTGMQGVEVSVAQSVHPIRLPLTFGNPYGFRGAYLVGRYDELVRMLLTARHVAMIDRESSEKLLDEGGRHVRRALATALGYKFYAITRDDVRLMTARAIEAQNYMGPLPSPVLDKSLRAAHAPDIRKTNSNVGIPDAESLFRRQPATNPPPDVSSPKLDAAPTSR